MGNNGNNGKRTGKTARLEQVVLQAERALHQLDTTYKTLLEQSEAEQRGVVAELEALVKECASS